MRKFLILIHLILTITFVSAKRNKPVAVVPFEMAGSYIVLKASVNGSIPLNFILDTGVRNTIITALYPDDSISITLSEIRDVKGLGYGADIKAYTSYNNSVGIGRLTLENRSLMVLEKDVFNLTRYTGMVINGIIGVDLLRDHVVYINYSQRRVFFYKPENFTVPKGFGEMPMIVEGQKMFIQLSVLETDSARRTIKMLIDTGAQLNAWFQTLTNKAINIPEKSVHGRIGEGLGGEITGFYARVPQICIANFCVKNPVVAFPDSLSIAALVGNTDRDGTIGSQLLCRFNLIIDFTGKKFCFKPNSNFRNPFIYNIAGVEVALSIDLLPQVEIINVWKNSPGEVAGLRPCDIITRIDNEWLFALNITQVRAFFEKPSRHPLKIIYVRNDKIFETNIDMTPKI